MFSFFLAYFECWDSYMNFNVATDIFVLTWLFDYFTLSGSTCKTQVRQTRIITLFWHSVTFFWWSQRKPGIKFVSNIWRSNQFLVRFSILVTLQSRSFFNFEGRLHVPYKVLRLSRKVLRVFASRKLRTVPRTTDIAQLV